MNFDYNKQPGLTLLKQDKLKKHEQPTISIITPFYSGHEFLEQTANCILNQTYPFFEWIIVNDGKEDKKSLELLKKVEKLDQRIKVYNKKNEGLAATRDYGAKKASECTRYLFFLDDDDLIEKTYLECAYWTLETNPNASFAYADCIGFGTSEYLWSKWFSLKEEKKQNMLVATAMIRKKDFFEVGGYNLKEKAINEDWIFWLKLFSYGKIPIRMNYYAFWYRRKDNGELKLSKKKENVKKTQKILEEYISKISKPIEAIQYPKANYDWNEVFKADINNLILPKYENNQKTKILMMIPWIMMGGADKFNIDLINGIDKEKYEVIVVTTEPGLNTWRQKLEESASVVYDLTTFIDRKYWHLFIKNIIESKNIDIIFNTNSVYGYSILPYLKLEFPKIPIMDYIHMEEWYNRNGGYSRDSSAVASVIDKTLTCNKNSANILVNYFKRDKKYIDTVYIGVDEEKFDIKKYDINKLKEEYNIPKDKFIINFLCRLDYQKRPFLMLEIIKELSKKKDNFICVVAGDGPLKGQMQTYTKNNNLSNKIMYIGAVKEPEKIYAISNLSLNCSIKEGLALTTYESLSMGVPVVSADVGGQKELIDEKVGAIVPCIQKEENIKDFNYSKEEVNNYIDSIIKIMDDEEKYKEETRKRIENGFTIKQMIKTMENEFELIKKVKPKTIDKNHKDICLEIINQTLLSYSKMYSYLCEENNFLTFGTRNYRNGWTTSKIKLTLIKLIEKLRIQNELKICKDILKDIGRLFKSIGKKIIKIFKKDN